MKKYQVGFSKAGGVKKNYRQHKRTYKQKNKQRKGLQSPLYHCFRCNPRWKRSNKGNCKFTTYLNVITLYTVPYVSICPDLSLLGSAFTYLKVSLYLSLEKKLGWSYLHEFGPVSYPVFPLSLSQCEIVQGCD